MVDAVRSNTPTAVITTDIANEALIVTVTNPTPTSGRPPVTSNAIWRRLTGTTGPWTLAGSCGPNSAFSDLFLQSSTTYDYFVRTDSSADSITYTATSPLVTGMWAQTATNPSSRLHFPYTDGHAESLDEIASVVQLVGRTYPVVESGTQETLTIAANVRIPFLDTDWAARVEWWRARKRDKGTLLYRDGRGRNLAVRIIGPVSITPNREGTAVTATLQQIDYSASTTTLDPAYYQAGVYNDGGNGIYGNGSQGNGY